MNRLEYQAHIRQQPNTFENPPSEVEFLTTSLSDNVPSAFGNEVMVYSPLTTVGDKTVESHRGIDWLDIAHYTDFLKTLVLIASAPIGLFPVGVTMYALWTFVSIHTEFEANSSQENLSVVQ